MASTGFALLHGVLCKYAPSQFANPLCKVARYGLQTSASHWPIAPIAPLRYDDVMTRTNPTITDRCEANGLRMTHPRRVIARVLEASKDHPDVEELYNRANAVDAGISIATVYRTVKLFEEAGILDKLEFGDGRARYEDAEREHHDHLIDMNSGEEIGRAHV